MDLSEVRDMIRAPSYGVDDPVIRKAREHGFRGQTHAGAKRYILRRWIARVSPVWEYAQQSEDRHPGMQETREQYRARRRVERMTERYAQELKLRISVSSPHRRRVLPHVASELHSITVCDEVAVIKRPPGMEYRRYPRSGMRRVRTFAALELHFSYPSVKLPLVGTIVEESIIMDAAPIEDGYRVRYTRGAKGATVVLETGYWLCDTLVKHADERKARVIALSRALGRGA